MNTLLKTLIVSCFIGSSLGGCTAVAIGGAAAVGGLSIADRRTTGAQADDQVMELNVARQIKGYLDKSPYANNSTVSVTSYNRQILLTGIVPNEQARLEVERIARSQQAARNVFNHITLSGSRGAGNVVDDSWITSKVRAMLLKPQGFSPNHVKIVTYDGTTYIMGILTPQEQAAVSHQVSTTAGVHKVVTLYETFNPVQ